MPELFEYFASHASYAAFDIQEFLKTQNSPTKELSSKHFKEFIESIAQTKRNRTDYKDAKRFANEIRKDGYTILKHVEFIKYWRIKEQTLTREKLRS